jgi:lipopolysaccharide export system protein LptA
MMFRRRQVNNLWRATISAFFLLAMAPAAVMAQQDPRQGLNFSSDEPLEIQGDRLEVMEEGRVNVLTGNVSVVQGPNLLRSGKMTVFFNQGSTPGATTGSNIERIVVEGGVYVKSEKQVATGDRGTYNMATEILELSGKEVVLTEGENVIVGCKLTIRGANGQATLESCQDGGNSAGGRVKMLITPPARNAD